QRHIQTNWSDLFIDGHNADLALNDVVRNLTLIKRCRQTCFILCVVEVGDITCSKCGAVRVLHVELLEVLLHGCKLGQTIVGSRPVRHHARLEWIGTYLVHIPSGISSDERWYYNTL